MPVLGIIYMRSYGGHEMSRGVRNVFLTSLDNIDDFIYRGNGVPEEFWGTFLIWKQCRRGQISSYGQNLILGNARWGPWSHKVHKLSVGIFLNLFEK